MLTFEGLTSSRDRLAAFERSCRAVASADTQACAAIAENLARAALAGKVLTYWGLASGVRFRAPGEVERRSLLAGDSVLRSEDLAVLNGILSFLTVQSYRGGRIVASALVVDRLRPRPCQPFLEFSFALGLVSQNRSKTHEDFWLREQAKVFAFFNRPISPPRSF